jgi:hypothetical protein
LKVTITVENDNNFNRGWLLYLLGLPRPDVDVDPAGVDGWDMGNQTPSIHPVRRVFENTPQYTVTADDAAPHVYEPGTEPEPTATVSPKRAKASE